MAPQRTARLKALSGLVLNLAVAVLSLGVLAPLLEFRMSPNGEFSIFQTIVAGGTGVVLVGIGLYTAGKAA